MSDPNFHLHIRSEAARRNTSAWLLLGLVSLVFAGVFSILLVMARTPVVQELIPLIDFFRVALVIHVTLSVLIWMLAISAALWSLGSITEQPWWDRVSFSLAAIRHYTRRIADWIRLHRDICILAWLAFEHGWSDLLRDEDIRCFSDARNRVSCPPMNYHPLKVLMPMLALLLATACGQDQGSGENLPGVKE